LATSNRRYRVGIVWSMVAALPKSLADGTERAVVTLHHDIMKQT